MLQKGFMLIFLFLFVIGMLGSGIILADSDNDNNYDDELDKDHDGDSDREDSEDNDDFEREDKEDENYEKVIEKIIIDDFGRKVKIKIKTEFSDGENKTEETREYSDEEGNRVKIKIKIEFENGESKTEIKKEIIYPDGTKVTTKTKTEIEGGEEEFLYSIKVKGAEMKTKLSIKMKTENNELKLKVKLSTGVEQDIIIFPDDALQIALEELQATNGFSFEIKELGKGDKTKAVFLAKAKKRGNLFGIFNVNVNLETIIDTQTGEIIDTSRPWWVFLVKEKDSAVVCHILDNSSVQTIDLAMLQVEAHVAHGDSVGECVVVCGDEIIVEGLETCDDGNLVDLDGCDNQCQIETII